MLDALGLHSPGSFDFSEETNYRDAIKLGDCDDAVQKLVDRLGWRAEFDAACAKRGGHAEIAVLST